ncbi:MAG: DUF447 family protein [Isosphaeraceae bacterium]|nr:DUF447 family protein [Isosphaeraceae bacterium]
MILEALVTTLSGNGALNIAPMGPEVDGLDPDRFVLKPFRTSQTFRNLVETRQGVLHVTDDVLLLARAAVGSVDDAPTRPAEVVEGRILLSASRWYEFRVIEIDDSSDRTRMEATTVARGRGVDLFGLNRAQHAVVEAAIAATRLGLLPLEQVLERYREWAVLVEKTGGPRERAAFAILEGFVTDRGSERRSTSS